MRLILIFLVGVLLLATLSAVPQTFNVNGRLTDSSGNALEGTYSLDFRIYDSYTGGDALWTDLDNSVTTDSNGIYNVILEGVNVSGTGQYYLGVEVDDDGEMSPRINLTSTPYTMRANVTDYLDSTKNYTLGHKLSFIYDEFIDNLVDGWLRITGGLNVTGGNFSVDDSTFYVDSDNGRVGIGTTSPGAKLHVTGNAFFNPPASTGDLFKITMQGDSFPSMKVHSPTGKWQTTGDQIHYEFPDANHAFQAEWGGPWVIHTSDPLILETLDSSDYIAFEPQNSEAMRITTSGNVGIGTTSPGAKLSVKKAGSGLQYGLQLINSQNAAGDATGILFTSDATETLQKGAIVYEKKSSWGRGDFHILQETTGDATNVSLSDAVMTIQNNGNVGIGTTSPNEKLEVRDGRILLSDADVSHPMTSRAEFGSNANVYGGFGPMSGTAGSLQISGVNDADAVYSPLSLWGYQGTASPTMSYGAVEVVGVKSDGSTGYTTLGNTERLFSVRNSGTQVLTVLGNGNVGIGTTEPQRALHVTGSILSNATINATTDVCIEGGACLSTVSSSAGGWTRTGTELSPTNAGDNVSVGTSDFFVDNTNGNVGIGTTSPGEKLDVEGNVQIGTALTDSNAGRLTFANGDSLAPFISGKETISGADSVMQISSQINAGIVVDINGNGLDRFDIRVGNSGTADTYALSVVDDGNVGIGTTSPSQELEVVGDIRINGSGDNFDIGHLGQTSVLAFKDVTGNNGLFKFQTSAGNTRAQIGLDGGDNTYFAIGGGNVGIGTTSPGAKLEVGNNIDAKIRISGDQDNNTADADTSIQLYNDGALKYTLGYDDTDDYFKIAGGEFSSATRLTIDSTGNVGIGTTSPGAKLEVSGDTVTSVITDGTSGGRFQMYDSGSNKAEYGYGPTGYGFTHDTGTYLAYSDALHIGALSGEPSAGEKVTILGDGNVGIGTTAPGSKLTVLTSSDNSAIDPYDYTGGLEIRGGNGATANTYSQIWMKSWATDGVVLRSFANTNNDIDFRIGFTNNNAFQGDKFTVKTNGNVGIGTTEPQRALHVTGSILSNATINATTDVCIEGGACLSTVSSSAGGWTRTGTELSPTNAGDNVSVGTSDFFVDNTNGRVGIGTTSPGSKLQVGDNWPVHINQQEGWNAIEFPAATTSMSTNAYYDGGWKYRKNYSATTLSLAGGFLAFKTAPSGTEDTTATFTERFRITNNGNVGIGTTSPNENLEIYSSSAPTNFSMGSATGNDVIFNNDGTALNIHRRGEASTMLINFTSNNVGIGTTDPGEALVVNDTTNATLKLLGDGGAGKSFIKFGADAAGAVKAQIEGQKNGGDGGTLSFSTTQSSVVTEVMRLDNSGNVGIGTTSPGALLHTAKSNANNDVFVDTYDDGASYSKLVFRKSDIDTVGTLSQTDDGDILGLIGFQGVNTGSSATWGAYIKAVQNGAAGAQVPTDIIFDTTTNSGYNNNVLVLSTGGNVGIGTTEPQRALHVTGSILSNATINATTDVCIEGGACLSTVSSSAGGWTRTGTELSPTNTGDNVSVGTSDFFVDNTNGNVGIGTTSPLGTLEITSSGASRGVVINDVGTIYNKYSSGAITIQGESNSGDTVLNPTSGNIGIGTTSPGDHLQIGDYGSASENLTIATSNDGTGAIYFRDNNPTEGGGIKVTGVSGGSTMEFFNRWDTDSTKVTFDLKNGNVGIGTTSPEGNLAFPATQSNTAKIQFMNEYSNTADATVDARSTADGTDILIASNYRLYNDGSTARFNTSEEVAGIHVNKEGTIDFKTNVAGSVPSSRMYITSNGNVGIGTTGPSKLLHINSASLPTFQITDSNQGTGSSDGFQLQQDGVNSYVINRENGFMQFLTNNTAQVTILNDGNVGIGTTSPNSPIHAYKTNDVSRTSVTEILTLDSYVGNVGGSPYNGFGTAIAFRGRTYNNAENRTLARISTILRDDSVTDNGTAITFSNVPNSSTVVAPIERMRIDYNGNVGIGTTSPSEKLEIQDGDLLIDDDGGAAVITLDGTADALINLKTTGSNAWTIWNDNSFGSKTNVLRIAGDGGTSDDLVTIQQDGNVGIGTTSPNYKTQIKSSGNTTALALQGDTTTVGEYVQLGLMLSTNDASTPDKWIRGYRGSPYGEGRMALGTGGTDQVTIDNDGNVGIGTTSPSEKLSIVGENVSFLASNEEKRIYFYTGQSGNNAYIEIRDNAENINTRLDGLQDSYLNVQGGNVGIGTTSPQTKLHVNGNILSNGTINSTSGASFGGKVGIGTTSPYINSNLHIKKGSSGVANAYGDSLLVLENDDYSLINLLTPNTGASGVLFGDPESQSAGYIWYDHSTDLLSFYSSNNFEFNSGNVGIGTTSPTAKLEVSNSTQGLAFNATGGTDDSPTMNTTGTTNVTITSSGGSVIIKLG